LRPVGIKLPLTVDRGGACMFMRCLCHHCGGVCFKGARWFVRSVAGHFIVRRLSDHVVACVRRLIACVVVTCRCVCSFIIGVRCLM
jgi:hypothetical protein